jgi:hypothetical protein
MSELDLILASIKSAEATQATRREWNPRHQGEIDISIATDGSWHHEGRRFQRDSMVKLFAGILRREQDEYYLVTPGEKLRIQVEDAPFVAVLVEQINDNGSPAIVFTTNIGERIIVDRAHSLRVEIDAITQQPRPYLQLHDGLEALISRSAFYDLLNLAYEIKRNGVACLAITSMGQEFELGKIDDQAN